MQPGQHPFIPDEKLNERLEGVDTVIITYDMLHLAPPQTAPEVIKNSSLAVAEGPNKGWLDVDIHTLQH